MSAYTQNIFVNIHSDFSHPFDVISSDGNIIDVTNLDFASQMRKHPDSSNAVGFAVTVLDAVNGKIQISMGSTLTGTLKQGRHVYDIVSTARSSGLKSIVVEGTVLVRAGISSGCF
jgi:hypothetical protein